MGRVRSDDMASDGEKEEDEKDVVVRMTETSG
jgi:hypothetical protein